MKPYFNREVTIDTIEHFVDGIGDLNPLYRDREYAKNTKYKCLTAPPNYIYTITYAQYPDDWPAGISGFYSGSAHEWFRPLCEGDKLEYRVKYPSDAKLMASQFAGQKVMSYETCDYFRGGAIVAVINHGRPGPKTRRSMRRTNTKKKSQNYRHTRRRT